MLKRYGIPTFYLLVVFACGLTVGVFGQRFYELKAVSAHTPTPRSPEEWKQRHLSELKRRLNLTTDQASQVSRILDGARDQSHVVLDTIRPQMEAIQRDQYARVKAILTPAQQAEYAKFHEERERERKEHPRP